jgi:hypothetical protein
LVAEPFALKSYPVALISLGLITAFLVIVVRIVWVAEATRDQALLVIVAMILALLSGWALASLFSPLTTTEESQFRRILGTLGGVISGFTLAKVSDLIRSPKGKFPDTAGHWVEIGFFGFLAVRGG